jgi:hypothetical protein
MKVYNFSVLIPLPQVIEKSSFTYRVFYGFSHHDGFHKKLFI